MKTYFFALCLFSLSYLSAQDTLYNYIPENLPVYKLEQRLMDGDKNALFEIAPLFDDKTVFIERLGYHIIDTRIKYAAKRIVTENTIFTSAEISIDTLTSGNDFKDFLEKNYPKITYSTLADAFLITPLEKRKIKYEIRQVTPNKLNELKSNMPQMLAPDWVTVSGTDKLIKAKDSKALLAIASECFKKRHRFDRYYQNMEEFTNLLQALIGIIIGVENELNEISWHIDKDFYSNSSLNLLIYFSKHYKDYKWDTNKQLFINTLNKPPVVDKEQALFDLLNNKNDSIALDAFISLSKANVQKVKTLAKEYNLSGIDASWALPTFPYRFLEQLVVLTDYCKTKSVDFEGTDALRNDIALLKTNLTFKERRKLENKLINSLTLDNITAFEYWSLIYQKSWNLTYSAGRITDIFYSRNWEKLMADKKHLDLYLKKSLLYDRLGIIGIVSDYLIKFKGTDKLETIKDYKTDDEDIKYQISAIVNLQKKEYKFYPLSEIDTTYYHVDELEIRLSEILNEWDDSDEKMDTLESVLARINYDQIGTALRLLDPFNFKKPDYAYSFLERDFGLKFALGDVTNLEERQNFLKLYNTFTEYALYSHFLDQAGIDYKNKNSKLDFDKIYDLIKYDAVTAFAGGGGGVMDNEVYALIKLLEFTFNTRLGMGNKFCASANMWACYSDDKVRAWSEYLKNHKLLKLPHKEPISFHTYKNTVR